MMMMPTPFKLLSSLIAINTTHGNAALRLGITTHLPSMAITRSFSKHCQDKLQMSLFLKLFHL